MKIRNLSVIAYTQGFTLWHYRHTEDTLAMALMPNYFHDAEGLFAVFDQMFFSLADASGILLVTRVSPIVETKVIASTSTAKEPT